MNLVNVLIVGSGGREHALAWKVAQSKLVGHVWVAPGNAGTAAEVGVENIAIEADAISKLLVFARSNSIDLTIVGPETPLIAGICDHFHAHGLKCFGPSMAAAQLEGSKSFTKAFLARHCIPTAQFKTFANFDKAAAYLNGSDYPVVIKADGLAAGKGVVIAHNLEQALVSLKQILLEGKFGAAGRRVVIEHFIHGEEVSFICMVAGTDIIPMASSQDHKAAYEDDLGPNTGGMGAYSPAPVVDDAMNQKIMQQVIQPVVNGLAEEGIPYLGFLYAGLMIDHQGRPHVIEFNCRFGDPEAQPIMMRMESDFVAHCLAAFEGSLSTQQIQWSEQVALGVVLAAAGYPDEVEKGLSISGINTDTDVHAKLFHGGTQMVNNLVVTDGGRVLCATALGRTVVDAKTRAYALAAKVSWEGCWYRQDIGYRAVEREHK